MKPAGRNEGEWKRVELQLDTAQILLVVAMLLGLCAASFYLGRRIERDRWQDLSGRASPSRTATITETDAAADLTFFDKLGGESSEPSRQARPEPSSPQEDSRNERGPGAGSDSADVPSGGTGAAQARSSPSTGILSSSGSAPSASSSPGTSNAPSPPSATAVGWAVQVFAGERTKAERIAASLEQKGFTARLVPGADGVRSARVRVVGYRSRAEAKQAAERLRKESNLKPWVVKPN